MIFKTSAIIMLSFVAAPWWNDGRHVGCHPPLVLAQEQDHGTKVIRGGHPNHGSDGIGFSSVPDDPTDAVAEAASAYRYTALAADVASAPAPARDFSAAAVASASTLGGSLKVRSSLSFDKEEMNPGNVGSGSDFVPHDGEHESAEHPMDPGIVGSNFGSVDHPVDEENVGPSTVPRDRTNSSVERRVKYLKNSKGRPKPSLVSSIEGKYTYVNKCDGVYRSTVVCGTFGLEGSDPDLCIYMDYKIGNVANETEVDDAIALDNGGFFIPNSDAGKEMAEIDSNEVCVYSGTFSASSRVQGDNILPIPLATSNGCTNDTTNFEFVVKATILNTGDLDIGFSNDYGNSYYTDDVECPGRYIGTKEDEDQRALGETKHRELIIPFILPVIIICGLSSLCDTVTDPIKELICPAPGRLYSACIPACPCEPNLKCALPELLPLQNIILQSIPGYSILVAFGVDPGICQPAIPQNFLASDSIKNLVAIAKRNYVGIQNQDPSIDRIIASALEAVTRELHAYAPNAFPRLPSINWEGNENDNDNDNDNGGGGHDDEQHGRGHGGGQRRGHSDSRNLQSYVIEAVAEEPKSEAPNDFSGLSSQGRTPDFPFNPVPVPAPVATPIIKPNLPDSGLTIYYGIGTEIALYVKGALLNGRWVDGGGKGSFECSCCGWGGGVGFGGDIVLGFQFPKTRSLGGRSWVIDIDFDELYGAGLAIGATATDNPVYNIEITIGVGLSFNLGSVSSCNCKQFENSQIVSEPSDDDIREQENFCPFL